MHEEKRNEVRMRECDFIEFKNNRLNYRCKNVEKDALTQ